jgi:hypothetical protein
MFEAGDTVLRPIQKTELLQSPMQTFHLFLKRNFDQCYFVTDKTIYFKIRTPTMHIPLVVLLKKTDSVSELLYHFHKLNRISEAPKLLDGEEIIKPEETLESCFNRTSPHFTFVMGDLFVKLE